MKLLTPFTALPLAVLISSAVAKPCNTSEPRRGAVASESAECSRIGTRFLKIGNAVDALVATTFCVGVMGMYHSGIGGGGFAIVRSKAGEYEVVDFRETAPAASFEDMYKNNTDASIYGGLASGVPGELRGLEYMHKKYGSVPWAKVVQPAIDLARGGFVVGADLVSYMNKVTPNNSFLTQDPTWAIDFAPKGHLLRLGERMTRKRLAATLETIAEGGADAFYTGPLAATTIAALRKSGGKMTLEDLANYTVTIRKPVSINYRGHKLHSCGAPSGGVVALASLKISDGFEGFGDPALINITTHRLDEAMRFAYGMRTKLGDPSFPLNGTNLTSYEASMLSDERIAAARSQIRDNTTLGVEAYNPDGFESPDTPGTSHVAVADADGMAVSLTTTVNLLFGSQVMVPETGVIMNNEMNDFSIPGSSNAFGYAPSPANYVKPGKRPLSSISPVIVDTPDGKLYLVVGAAGGSRIISSTVQNVHRVLDRNMSIVDAIKAPRLHDQLVPNVVSFEWAFDNSTVAYMKTLGHNVSWIAPGQSSAQGVRLLLNGTFEAAGEPRQADSGGFAV